jgi:hypothetical protein
MLIPFGHQESSEARRKRLFLGRLKKARDINNRLTNFLNDVKTSSYKETEKQQIIACLTVLNEPQKPDKN